MPSYARPFSLPQSETFLQSDTDAAPTSLLGVSTMHQMSATSVLLDEPTNNVLTNHYQEVDAGIRSSSFVLGPNEQFPAELSSDLSTDLLANSTNAFPYSFPSKVRTNTTGGKSAIPASLQKRIVKTKICVHNLRGRCARASRCQFAHSKEELRQPPDLYKTRLCVSFASQAWCPNGDACRFAHGEAELRWTPEFYKTSLCPYWQKDPVNGCGAAASCRWAHGEHELRSRTPWYSPTATASAQHADTGSSILESKDVGNLLETGMSDTVKRNLKEPDVFGSNHSSVHFHDSVSETVQQDGKANGRQKHDFNSAEILRALVTSTASGFTHDDRNAELSDADKEKEVKALLVQQLLSSPTVNLFFENALQHIARAANATTRYSGNVSSANNKLSKSPDSIETSALLPNENSLSSTLSTLQRLTCDQRQPKASRPFISQSEENVACCTAAHVSPQPPSLFPAHGSSESGLSQPDGPLHNDDTHLLCLPGETTSKNSRRGKATSFLELTETGRAMALHNRVVPATMNLPAMFSTKSTDRLMHWPHSSPHPALTQGSQRLPGAAAFSSAYDPYESISHKEPETSLAVDQQCTGELSPPGRIGSLPQQEPLDTATEHLFHVGSFGSFASSLALGGTPSALQRGLWCQSATASSGLGQVINGSSDSFFPVCGDLPDLSGSLGLGAALTKPDISEATPVLTTAAAAMHQDVVTPSAPATSLIDGVFRASSLPAKKYETYFGRGTAVHFYDEEVEPTAAASYHSKTKAPMPGIAASSQHVPHQPSYEDKSYRCKTSEHVNDDVAQPSLSRSCSSENEAKSSSLEHTLLRKSSRRSESAADGPPFSQAVSSSDFVTGATLSNTSSREVRTNVRNSMTASATFAPGGGSGIMLEGGRFLGISDRTVGSFTTAAPMALCPQYSCPEYLHQSSSSLASSTLDEAGRELTTRSPTCSPHAYPEMDVWASTPDVLATTVSVPSSIAATLEDKKLPLLSCWNPCVSRADTASSSNHTAKMVSQL